jgi:hypothetical protein
MISIGEGNGAKVLERHKATHLGSMSNWWEGTHLATTQFAAQQKRHMKGLPASALCRVGHNLASRAKGAGGATNRVEAEPSWTMT